MRHMLALLGTTALVIACISLAFFGADLIATNEAAGALIAKFGILGIIFAGMVGGFNIFVPVPPASLAPIFLEAGFSLPVIILGISLGTFTADTLSYALGAIGKSYADSEYPRVTAWFGDLIEHRRRFVLPFVLLFVVLAPLPNEVILIPLALAGYTYRKLALALFLGTFLHQTILVIGLSHIFTLFF